MTVDDTTAKIAEPTEGAKVDTIVHDLSDHCGSNMTFKSNKKVKMDKICTETALNNKFDLPKNSHTDESMSDTEKNGFINKVRHKNDTKTINAIEKEKVLAIFIGSSTDINSHDSKEKTEDQIEIEKEHTSRYIDDEDIYDKDDKDNFLDYSLENLKSHTQNAKGLVEENESDIDMHDIHYIKYNPQQNKEVFSSYKPDNFLNRENLENQEFNKDNYEALQSSENYDEPYFLNGCNNSSKNLTPKFKRSRNWGREETQSLLRELFNIVKDLSSQKRDTALRSNSTFECVADKLNGCGFDRNAQACLVRWRNILRIYKTQRKLILDAGGDVKQYPFAMEIENIFRNDLDSLIMDNNKDEKYDTGKDKSSEIESYNDDGQWTKPQSFDCFYIKPEPLDSISKKRPLLSPENNFGKCVTVTNGPKDYFSRFSKNYKPPNNNRNNLNNLNNLNRCYSSEAIIVDSNNEPTASIDNIVKKRMSISSYRSPKKVIYQSSSARYLDKVSDLENHNSIVPYHPNVNQQGCRPNNKTAENEQLLNKIEKLEARINDFISSVNYYYKILETSFDELRYLKAVALSNGSDVVNNESNTGCSAINPIYTFNRESKSDENGTKNRKDFNCLFKRPDYERRNFYKDYTSKFISGSNQNS
ncbi:hypothetical protein BB561_001804 [Smittium simulii]|uniref:Myb/SANT-like DNA-binding domain-containing protein n=1 Tax=Smittium simulii TaxID=133385 RepID=A0A2T9YT01_9FUNG|nr:hypothetical protein BB561_001804 [Smittium simulii]